MSFKSLPWYSHFLTPPAPARCAPANSPDSVMTIPFILLPTNFISRLRILLFSFRRSFNAFSCISGVNESMLALK